MNYRFIPLILVTLFASKLLVLSGSFADATFLAILAAYGLFHNKFEQTEKFTELHNKIKQLEAKDADQDLKISEITTHVGGIKLSQNMRFSK